MPTPAKSTPLADSVETGVRSVVELERQFDQTKSLPDKITDLIADFSGTLYFVVLHLTWFLAWFLVNTGLVPGIPRFDPYPFILLAMIVSVEGVVLSTFVLMKQNRMQRKTDQRDHLNLQIDLLAEKEITKVLQVLRLICRKLEIEEVEGDRDLDQMQNTTSVNVISESLQNEMSSSNQD